MSVNYDQLAREYKNYRIPDSRIEAAIAKHIAPNTSVVNIGAGLGAYEPVGCATIAVEPSREMIARRSPTKSPAIQAYAELLPFADQSFDVSMAILTLHHWQNLEKGLQEMLRVTRGKTIILTWNGIYDHFWLIDYFPDIADVDSALFPSMDYLIQQLGGAKVEVIEIPHDCSDGFMCAYWRRPEMYLDAAARLAISTFSRLGNIDASLDLLRRDLQSGAWYKKYSTLLNRHSLDCGYRLVIHDRDVA